MKNINDRVKLRAVIKKISYLIILKAFKKKSVRVSFKMVENEFFKVHAWVFPGRLMNCHASLYILTLPLQ